MWGRGSISKVAKDEKYSAAQKSSNVNEEYLHAFRTQSYVDFFNKAQLLINEPSRSPQSSINSMEILLEPEQHLVPSIIKAFANPSSDLKPLMLSYFDTSAQASRICSKLLTSINETHANYSLIQKALNRFSNYSPEQYDSAISELNSFSLLRNPFSDPNPDDFKLICNHFSSILRSFKLKQKKVSKRVRLIEFVKKAAGVCLTVACSVAALLAIGIAVHSISGIFMGPVLLGFSPILTKRKFSIVDYFKCRSLKKLKEQLDVAAKGAYILNRDFDTMSRVVARLRDEVEHKKDMIKFCLERKEDRFPLAEVVKELRKNSKGFKRQVEELEQHVCLCLVTINRARVLLINEMSNPC